MLWLVLELGLVLVLSLVLEMMRLSGRHANVRACDAAGVPVEGVGFLEL